MSGHMESAVRLQSVSAAAGDGPGEFTPNDPECLMAPAATLEHTFELPADLAALTPEELDAAETAALDAFDELNAGDPADLTDDAVAQMRTLTEGVEAIQGHRAERAAAAEQRSQEVADLTGRMRPATEAAEGEETAGTEGSEGGEAETSTTEEIAENAGGEGTTLTASGRPKAAPVTRKAGTIARAAASTQRPKVVGIKPGAKATLVAAADMGVGVGTEITDTLDLAALAMKRVRGFPKGGQNGRVVAPLASVMKPTRDHLVAAGDNQDSEQSITDMLAYAANEKNLPGGSLVASGGWCAPSETLYDLCSLETVDGILSLPETTINRGGIKFTTGPDFSAIYANTGFIVTEAMDVAGFTKPCYHIPCPPFSEERLEAIGLCLTAGILTERGYPELVQRWIDGALIAHEHRVNAEIISLMVARLPAPIVYSASGEGAATAVLGALELFIEYQREYYLMEKTATMEVVIPMWMRGVFRADYSRKTGLDSPLQVTDEMINEWFALRYASVQWVYDWQSLAYTQQAKQPYPTNTVAPTAWPTTVDIMVYPAGTFVKGTDSIIRLDAVYDSTLFRQNDYTALFTEEGLLVAKRCYGGGIIRIPISPNGVTSLAAKLTTPIA